ncbi:MAG TPA: nuclear transport factor 2 family protein [Gemmatales bacterium]|nr:nuclear transport factor 2 family protein [Gemmatales bacterium]
MKHLLVAALFLLFQTSATQADTKQAGGDEGYLKKFIEDFQAAVVKEDMPYLEKTLHPDYVHTRPNGNTLSRAQFLDSIKSKRLDYEKLTTDEVKVRLYGEMALVTGHSGVDILEAKGERKGETRWTRVFLKKDGQWKLLAFQATMVKK